MNKADKIKALLADPSNSSIAMLTAIYEFPLERTYQKIHDKNGVSVLDIRGWGNLNGAGALRLDFETASKAQDQFADEILSVLNKEAQRILRGE